MTRGQRIFASTVLVGSVFACSAPVRSPVVTLDSPRAVVASRFCEVTDSRGTYFAEAEACRLDDGTLDVFRLVSRAAIASHGSRMVHLVDTDLNEPRIVDLDASLPGNTGIIVDEGPTALVALEQPGLVVASTDRDLGVVLLDIALGVRVGDAIEIDAPLTMPSRISGNTIVWASPSTEELVVTEVSVDCDGESVHGDWCEIGWTFTETLRYPLDGTPRALASREDGRVWVARDGFDDVIELGLAGDALATDCAGAACELRRLSARDTCSDGLDNDGDGSGDRLDPQCLATTDREDGRVTLGALTACSDGLDNDGDGSGDGDDTGCRDSADGDEGSGYTGPTCSNGLDDDLDGERDGSDADCSLVGEERGGFGAATTLPAAPRCADGVDNDLDGSDDFAADAECYGPSTESESGAPRVMIAGIALADGGDLLLVVDATTPQVLVFDADSGERLDVNDGDPLRSLPGIPIPARIPTGILVDTVTIFDELNDAGGRATVTERIAHIPTTTGLAYTVDLDRTFTIVDAEGSEIDRQVVQRFQRWDEDANIAAVGEASCTIANSVSLRYEPAVTGCGDERLPRLGVLEEGSGDKADVIVALPEYSTWDVNDERTALSPDTRPYDWRVAGDSWRLVYEGELPASLRTDAHMDEDGWIAFVADNPCESGLDPCVVSSSIDECPQVAELCNAGADLCAHPTDLCTVCPAACGDPIDLCSAGLTPGDLLTVESLSNSASLPAECASFNTEGAELEYRVAEVEERRVRIEQIEGNAGLIPTECQPAALSVNVRAPEAWVLYGASAYGHPSPWRSVGGVCVPRDDFDSRSGRVREGELYVSPFDFAFRIDSGTEPAVRDLELRFDIDSSFTTRDASSGILQLGSSPSGSARVDTLRGERLIFVDEAQNVVIVFNANTFRPVVSPIP